MKKIFELNNTKSKLDYIKISAPLIYKKLLSELTEATNYIADFKNRMIIEDAVLEAFNYSGNEAIITTDLYNVPAIKKYLTKEHIAQINGKFKVIDSLCFSHCTALENVVFEEGVECIKERVLYENTTIKSITLPKSLTFIGNGAFQKCKNLDTVTFLNPKTWVSPNSFDGTKWFEQFTEDFIVVNGQLLKYNGTDKVLQIPEGTVHISHQVFCNNENIEAIICPHSLEGIWTFSFANCINLKKVVLNNGLKMICTSAFEDCQNLQEIELPRSLEDIGAMAFNKNTFVRFYDTNPKIAKHIKETYPQYKIID